MLVTRPMLNGRMNSCRTTMSSSRLSRPLRGAAGAATTAGGSDMRSAGGISENSSVSGTLSGRTGPKSDMRGTPLRRRSSHHSGSSGRNSIDFGGTARSTTCGGSLSSARTAMAISSGSVSACGRSSIGCSWNLKAARPSVEPLMMLASTLRFKSRRDCSLCPRPDAVSRLPAKKPTRKNAATTLRKRMPTQVAFAPGWHERHRNVARYATVRRTSQSAHKKSRWISMINVHFKFE
jgi:hypothetical protein